MNTTLQTKPSLVTAIGIMTLVNGIFNIIWGLGLTLGTFLLCLPLGILPIILGAFEIGYAVKLFSNPPQPLQPSTAIAWWEIAAILAGNVFSAVVGILVLVFYNDSIVKDYFARLNNPQTPPSPPSADPVPAPASLVESTPEPVAPPAEEVPAWLKPEAPAQPVEEDANPSTAKKKSPAKAKPVRKIAKK